MSIDQEIRACENELRELMAKKKRIEDPKNIVVSTYSLPEEIEAVVGHLVNNQKRDFLVYACVYDGIYKLGLDDIDINDVKFVTKVDDCCSDIVGFRRSGEIFCNDWNPDFEIPYIDENNSHPYWFCCVFKYTPKGYYIERLPVNMETGEIVWPSEI